MVSISFYIELREARECIHLLTIDNARLRKHIKYLEKQIDLREDEISFIGYKYDSLRFELKKLENNKEK